MGRQKAPIEVNKFTGGLMTDSNPLTSPDGYALDLINLRFKIDGSIQRRLGLAKSAGGSDVTTSVAGASDTSVNSFKWDNVSGDPDREFLVVQIGNEIKFFDLSVANYSASVLYTYTFSSLPTNRRFTFAVVDGILVVATGEKTPTTFEFSAPSTFTVGSVTLYIRDLFGVGDIADGYNLFDGSSVQYRPLGPVTDAHVYNLRNQSFGVPRVNGNNEDSGDPIARFNELYNLDLGQNRFPSNSDFVGNALYPDPNDTDNRIIDRFFASDLMRNTIGSTVAPKGYFIIDALERGASRIAEEAKNRVIYSALTTSVSTLPTDRTPGGPKIVSQFAGRIFYAGFSGEVVGGDSQSPKMSSYVLFSRVVNNQADTGRCYQDGDPTSKNAPDIIDTDGGFIRINGAYGIIDLINLGDGLIVVAANGIWRIIGGTENGFTATSYIVEKLSDRGCTNPETIVLVDNTIMFWGEDAIYHIKQDQFGSWGAENISTGRIQSLYNGISTEQRQLASGKYDEYSRTVSWIYQNQITGTDATYELSLDLALSAFLLNRIDYVAGQPKVVSNFQQKPYTADGELKDIGYLAITQTSPVVKYAFATCTGTDWKDWGITDAAAYIVTNYISGGDFQRSKQAPYVTVYLRRTETGFDVDYNPQNVSSCVLQTMWEWTDNGNSGKWGRPFQAYRHGRLWFPEDASSAFDDGHPVVVTRNKVRGSGRVLSIKFSTEPDKAFHLYGWSMIVSVKENV